MKEKETQGIWDTCKCTDIDVTIACTEEDGEKIQEEETAAEKSPSMLKGAHGHTRKAQQPPDRRNTDLPTVKP